MWTTVLDPEEIRDQATSVLEKATTEFKNVTQGEAYPERADEETCQFVRYWFDGYARRQLTALSIAIGSLHSESIRRALWCAFSRLIITKQSGASRAMDLSHSRPHRAFETAPTKPFDKFLSAVDRVIANSIDKMSSESGPEPMIKMADARQLPLPDHSVDLVLTSPPYLNAIDYIRCSKFSLVWMGYSVSELRRIRTDSVGTEATRGSPTDDDTEIKSIIEALKLRPKLEKRHELILRKYIQDMRDALSEVGRVLSSGGRAVYVVGENTLRGTYIHTSVVVSKLAELAGLAMKERRTRTLPANRRYMPPPSRKVGTINARTRREVVMTFAK